MATLLGLAASMGALRTYRNGFGGLERLRMEDWYTTDRCTVYAYIEDEGMGDGASVEVWRRTWAAAGWKPVVLDERHAAAHPNYEEFKSKFASYPTTNPAGYEVACYLRHLALAAVGGGWLCDYDLFNVNLAPPPKCDWLPNDGAFTTHDSYVPALTSGTADEYTRIAAEMAAADVEVVMAATPWPFAMVSDMVFMKYFEQTGAIKTRFTTLTSPTFIRNPPCDEHGVEFAPMVFHMSHDMMTSLNADMSNRAGFMTQMYEGLMQSKAQCTQLTFDNNSDYANIFFPETPTPMQHAYAVEYRCANNGGATCGDMTPEEINQIIPPNKGALGQAESTVAAEQDALPHACTFKELATGLKLSQLESAPPAEDSMPAATCGLIQDSTTSEQLECPAAPEFYNFACASPEYTDWLTHHTFDTPGCSLNVPSEPSIDGPFAPGEQVMMIGSSWIMQLSNALMARHKDAIVEYRGGLGLALDPGTECGCLTGEKTSEECLAIAAGMADHFEVIDAVNPVGMYKCYPRLKVARF